MRRKTLALAMALTVALSSVIVLTATQPASADTRYETVLVESNCRVVTDYAKVQTPEQAAAGTYTLKPTTRTVCDRVYDTRPYYHAHWYHVACAGAGAATKGKTGAGISTACGWMFMAHI